MACSYIVFLLLSHNFFLRKTTTKTNTAIAPTFAPRAMITKGSRPSGIVPVGVVVSVVVLLNLLLICRECRITLLS